MFATSYSSSHYLSLLSRTPLITASILTPITRGFRNRVSQPPPGRPGRHPGHPRGGISRGHFPDVRRRQGHRFNVREVLAGVVGDLQSRRRRSLTPTDLLERGILRGHFRMRTRRRSRKPEKKGCQGCPIAAWSTVAGSRRSGEVFDGLFFADPGRALKFPRKVYSSGCGTNPGERSLKGREGF